MSIPDDLDPRDLRYFTFLAARRNGVPDEDTARNLGFFGDPKMMFGKLASDGYPICKRCGTLHPDADHVCGTTTPKKPGGIKGEIEELPEAAGAVPLFEAALDRLRRDMAWLPKRKEYLKGGRRFVASHELSGKRGESVRVYDRDGVGPERWEGWCRERDLDPLADAHQVPWDYDAPLTVPKDHPAWPLPELITAYVLAGKDMGDLVDALHPVPDQLDRTELDEAVARLRRFAELVAALVRGAAAGQTRAWKRAREITAAERRLAIHVRERLRGIPGDREQALRIIADQLRDGGFDPLPTGFEPTIEEILRIADFD